MPRDLIQREILTELEPIAEDCVHRHLSMTKDWHPHDYIPWEQGRNFAMLGGIDWDPDQSRLSEVAKAAMITNLLTEDNLPSYHREISGNFSRDGAWGTWIGRWIADKMSQRIAADENLHMIFYRTVCGAALDLVPDQAIEAVDAIVRNFQMPGAGLPNFRRHGVLMAKHGVYDLRQHLEEVLAPVLRQWNIFGRNDFTARGEQVREWLATYLDDLERVRIPEFEEQRDRLLARERARA
ncbi:acyl-ACP desaturase [Nocardia sp. NPDC050175]|uniref:acyl-ACP desaturase n=1 Tax=Nocardia sp. NPDC050175 TaxID=3364317 RepID=UPI0037BB399F